MIYIKKFIKKNVKGHNLALVVLVVLAASPFMPFSYAALPPENKTDIITEPVPEPITEEKRSTLSNSTLSLLNKELTKTYKPAKTIGIELSNSCIIMVKNELENNPCPSYEFLMALKLDTSKKASGEFIFDDDGFYHRGKPFLKNDHLLYNLNEFNIIIDPSATMRERIPMITISPNLGVYIMPENLKKIDNTRVYHTDRYIENCKYGHITANTWLETLDDTIFFMRNGCVGYLGGTEIVIEDPVTEIDITQSNKWKLDQWYNEIKEEYKENKIGRDTKINPAVSEDEDQ